MALAAKTKGPMPAVYPETAVRLKRKFTERVSLKQQKSSSGNNARKSTQAAGFRHMTVRAAARRGGRGLDLTLRNPSGK